MNVVRMAPAGAKLFKPDPGQVLREMIVEMDVAEHAIAEVTRVLFSNRSDVATRKAVNKVAIALRRARYALEATASAEERRALMVGAAKEYVKNYDPTASEEEVIAMLSKGPISLEVDDDD